MIYMILCSFVMVMGMQVMFSHMAKGWAGRTVWDMTEALAIPFLTLALISPFAVTLSFLDRTMSFEGFFRLSLGSQWVGLLAAVSLCIIYTRRAWLATRRFWYCGTIVATLLLTFIFADSLWFVSGNDIAVVSPFQHSENENSVVDCPRETMLVHYVRGGPSDWRCPENIVLLGQSPRPFLPWPDYRSGQSQQLSDAVSTLMDSAQSAQGSQKP